MIPFEAVQASVKKSQPDPLTALENIEREISELVADVRRGRFVRDDGCLLGNVVDDGNETLEFIASLRGVSE